MRSQKSSALNSPISPFISASYTLKTNKHNENKHSNMCIRVNSILSLLFFSNTVFGASFTCVFLRVLPCGEFSLAAQLRLSQCVRKICARGGDALLKMALDTGMKCIKYLLFIFNLLFVVSTNLWTLVRVCGGRSRVRMCVRERVCVSMFTLF